MTEIEIRPTRYGAPVARKLIAELMADLTERYGGGDATPIEAVEFDPPDGGFFVAYLDGAPVACGGWRSWSETEDVAEIKRVYTAPAARGRGLGRRIMAALEADAKAHGRKRAVLETGTAQPEAIAMYHAVGWELIENFGHYRDEPGCRSFGRDL
ncbi:GNAT family N-acetyltransferase [Catellatospora sp. KI3]|uniref:GNAT family N-acetyltransferase n=1 Tax=Catellatospora sp. KI3 TaxID=3041620 RepID=UPI002482E288|nr:GNAT family N-acetyltransferase [Catellatospora sp. KI3]MDI1459514.1 GNAT family N-acetyltransferase [Catellatospora sp. KI3]